MFFFCLVCALKCALTSFAIVLSPAVALLVVVTKSSFCVQDTARGRTEIESNQRALRSARARNAYGMSGGIK